jgi:hypothetical protein
MPAVPAWDATVGTACNVALTALGLGGLLAGGVPAMLPSTPIVDAGVETRAALGATATAGSACFIFPFRSVRTTCAIDEEAEAELVAIGGQAGAPVNPGEFTPHIGGAAVDTLRELEKAALPGDTASAMNDDLGCKQIDLLAQPDFALPDLTDGATAGESSFRDPVGREGVATGLTSDVVGVGQEGRSNAAGGGASGRAAVVAPGARPSPPSASLAAAPANQMSSTRKTVAAVLAGLIALVIAYMCIEQGRNTAGS